MIQCFHDNFILFFRIGETYFAGWFYKVDAALFVHMMHMMPGMKGKRFICLNDLLNFKDLRGIKSMSNGKVSAVKKESKINGWLPFLKIFLEWGRIVTEGQKQNVTKGEDEGTQEIIPEQNKKTVPKKIGNRIEKTKE